MAQRQRERHQLRAVLRRGRQRLVESCPQLAKQVAILQQNPEVGFVYCDILTVDETGEPRVLDFGMAVANSLAAVGAALTFDAESPAGILKTDPALQKLIISGPSRDELRDYLDGRDFHNLFADGLSRVLERETTIEEVSRVTSI